MTKTEPAVRALKEHDRPEWERLWAAYNAFYGREGEAALSSEVVDKTWARLLDRAQPVHGLIAQVDNNSVGLAHIVFHLNLIQTRQTCYMQDLFTAPSVRGMGIATSLIEGVVGFCRTQGIKDVYWHTHETNFAARRLYGQIAQDTGFVVYRIKPL